MLIVDFSDYVMQSSLLRKRHLLRGLNLIPLVKRNRNGQADTLKELAKVTVVRIRKQRL